MEKIKQTVTYQLNLIKWLSLLIIVLVAVAFVVHYIKPQPLFYAYSPTNNSYESVESLEQPNVTIKGLLTWASFAITSIYTLDFVNYQTTLEDIKEFFTPAGYTNYLAQLSETNKIIDIAEKKLVTAAVLNGTPVVISEDILGGLHTWKVQIPLLITYQGASETSTQEEKLIQALIIKDPESPKGIGIAQIVEQALSIS